MKNIKGIILIALGICTLTAIVYLAFLARKLDRYASSYNQTDLKLIFIMPSELGHRGQELPSTCMDNLINYVEKNGAEAKFLEDFTSDNYKDAVKREIDINKKNILIKLCTTKLIKDKNTVLLRVGSREAPNYEKNYLYVNQLSDLVTERERDIKINIICDKKENYNYDMGDVVIRLEVSDNLDGYKADELITKLISGIIMLQ